MPDQNENGFIDHSSMMVAEIKRLAEENPGYVYGLDPNNQMNTGLVGCQYVDRRTLEGKCIVGKAGINLGIPAEFFLHRNEVAIECFDARIFKEFDLNDLEFIRIVQRGQDNSLSWGSAVNYALTGKETEI